jgi:uncharacterized protein DUF4190
VVRLTCPRCATTFEPSTGVAPRCPSCGYAPGPAGPATPPTAPPTYGYPGQPPAAQTWAPNPPPSAPAPTGTNGLATGALVCGLLGFCFMPLAIVAIILGVSAKRQIRETRQGGDGLATAGIVLGLIEVAIGIIFLIVFLIILAAAPGAF